MHIIYQLVVNSGIDELKAIYSFQEGFVRTWRCQCMSKETEHVNEQYRREICRLIDKTEDTHALCCTYTMILTHLKFDIRQTE